jgi:hypothetical protein
MFFSSLVLTISTCISGCSSIANGIIYESLLEKATTIINAASNGYDYSDYDLSSNEESSLIKQQLFEYYQNNGYLTTSEINTLNQSIKSSSDYTYFPNLDTLFINQDNYESLNTLNECKEIFKDIVKTDNPYSYNVSTTLITRSLDLPKISLSSLNSNFSIYSDNNGGSSTNKFPILEYNEDNVSYYSSGKIDNTNFMGIICSKDACISLYNLIAKFFNNMGNNNVNNSKGIGGIILEALKSLDTVGCASTAIIAAASTKIATALSSIFSKIMLFLQSFSGIVTKIVSIIISIIGIACIVILSFMCVLGYMKKGFAIGWKIYGFLNFKWFCGMVY